MLMTVHCPAAEGNFCDEQGSVLKPATVREYNRHMGLWTDVTA
jgi:hypothetical protein